MRVRQLNDPRLEQLFNPDVVPEPGVRPQVPLRRKGVPTWALAAVALAAAVLLFVALEARRIAPVIDEPRRSSSPMIAVPEQPLLLPPRTVLVASPPATVVTAQPPPVYVTPALPRPTPVPQSYVAPVYNPTPTRPSDAQIASAGARPQPNGPALVFDSAPSPPAPGPDSQAPQPGAANGLLEASPWGGRARAGMLANPSTTVAQGVLIPAVLETGFNSTQAGLARALVSRDVRSFDGSRVLIPRGSRLIGEYRSEVAPSQKRAIITWTRLIRTDGLTISLNSPSVDPVGRGGVRARVNNHILARVTGALLQTTMNLGASLATRSSAGNVVVAVPGSGQAQSAASSSITPTLSVAPGTTLSIFVAQDLDFGSGLPGR